MADDPKPDLAKLLTEKVQHGRSSLQKWTWENYDQISQGHARPTQLGCSG